MIFQPVEFMRALRVRSFENRFSGLGSSHSYFCAVFLARNTFQLRAPKQRLGGGVWDRCYLPRKNLSSFFLIFFCTADRTDD